MSDPNEQAIPTSAPADPDEHPARVSARSEQVAVPPAGRRPAPRVGWNGRRTGALALVAGAAMGAAVLVARRPAPVEASYPPLDTPKPIGDGIWIVDGAPISAMGLELPVRMTVARVGQGDLLLHSPIRFTPALGAAVEALGRVRHLVAPSLGHWTFVEGWQDAFPEATVWAVPGLRDRAQVRASDLRIDRDLGGGAPPEWADAIEQGLIPGAAGFREAWFLHKPSATLVLTDLIQNLDPERLPPLQRGLMRLMAATRGTTTAYLRPVLRMGGAEARAEVRRMLALEPEQVVFAHGQWFRERGAERLARGFGWFVG